MKRPDFEPQHLTFHKQFGPRRDPIVAGVASHKLDFAAHDHDFVEIALVCAGRGDHDTIHGRHLIRAGHVIVLRPGAWHAYCRVSDLTIYNCCFGPELLTRELAWVRDDPLMDYFLWAGPASPEHKGVMTFVLPPAELPRCADAAAMLTAATKDRASGRAERIGCLLRFLALLAPHVGPMAAAAARAECVHPAVRSGTRFLEESPAQDWTVEQLADRVGVAASYLIRLFRKWTGLPPMAYLARVRLERAAAMLLGTDLPVGEISHRVGWSDQNYFARRFKAHFGISARAYRAKYLASAPARP